MPPHTHGRRPLAQPSGNDELRPRQGSMSPGFDSRNASTTMRLSTYRRDVQTQCIHGRSRLRRISLIPSRRGGDTPRHSPQMGCPECCPQMMSSRDTIAKRSRGATTTRRWRRRRSPWSSFLATGALAAAGTPPPVTRAACDTARSAEVLVGEVNGIFRESVV
jgi:hypothetical protein